MPMKAWLLVAAMAASIAMAQTADDPPQIVTIAERKGEIPSLMYATKKTAQSSALRAAAFVTLTDKLGEEVAWEDTQVFGTQGSTTTSTTATSTPMTLDRCTAMGRMSELIFVYAFLQVWDQYGPGQGGASNPTMAILPAHSPGGVSLVHPTNGKALRYVDLMNHQSTLLDAPFELATANVPSTVSTLKVYIEQTFVTGSGVLNSGLFNTNQEPGTASAYSHSRMNIALLAYITEVMLGPTGANTEFTTIESYIYHQVLVKFGMSSTFFLNNNGAAPGLTVGDGTATSEYFSGCIFDNIAGTRRIHPGLVDYMMYTTASDLGRLAYHLFLDADTNATAARMKTPSTVTDPTVPAKTKQGYGVEYFNGATLCTAATSTSVISTCPLTADSNVYGYLAVRDFVGNTILCLDGAGEYVRICHVGVSLYSSSNPGPDVETHYAVAAATIQGLIGTIVVQTPAPTDPIRTDDEERVFGVWIFIGVYLSLLLIVFGTSFIQYLVNPAAVASNTDTGATAATGPSAASPDRGDPNAILQGRGE